MPKLTHHPNLTNKAYHALGAVSPSRLKLLNQSPLHYFDRYLAPDREPQESTLAMQIGTAFHTAVLEPDLWSLTVAIPTEKWDRRTAAGKAAAAEFEQEAADRIILTPADAAKAQAMAAAVRAHPAARFILAMEGRREASYTWDDKDTGIPCKTRPDFHTADRRFVVDLKSTADASRDAFTKSIANYDYHVQTAWNIDALETETFLTIAVESQRPYAVAVYPASSALIAAGQRRIQTAMDLLAQCLATGHWAGYGDQIQDPIDLPTWNHD
jgi:exodeoxyribonuclease VIII